MSQRLTSKGQVTIPKPIRDYLEIGPQDQVEFQVREGQVILTPVRTSLLDFRGFLRGVRPLAAPETAREAVKQAVARHAAGAEMPPPRRRVS